MLFDTQLFLYAFLPASLAFFYLFSKLRFLKLCHLSLIVSSLFFYAYWQKSHLWVLLGSICFNYVISFGIVKKKYSKRALILAIAANLCLLVYFKYRNFIFENLRYLFSIPYTAASFSLPLGISFFTFTQIAYQVDIYQKKTKPHDFTHYSLFVLFFPHLVAGPIVHYSHIMPQFEQIKKKILYYPNLVKGVFYFILGLAEKVILADSLHGIANYGFDHPSSISALAAWKSLFAYTFQIYFDFAGYSNMAIGLALLFNIQFPVNFNSPYQATSIIEFWRRWHITLSGFLKNYIYIPLGGNKNGKFRQYINILMTMLIGGVWHGASWTFVLWGLYHGILIVLNHEFRRISIHIPALLSRFFTFLLVAFGWVLFKSENFNDAAAMSEQLWGIFNPGLEFWREAAGEYVDWLKILGIAAFAFFAPNAQWWEQTLKSNLGKWVIVLSFLFIASYLSISKSTAANIFLYWQF